MEKETKQFITQLFKGSMIATGNIILITFISLIFTMLSAIYNLGFESFIYIVTIMFMYEFGIRRYFSNVIRLLRGKRTKLDLS